MSRDGRQPQEGRPHSQVYGVSRPQDTGVRELLAGWFGEYATDLAQRGVSLTPHRGGAGLGA